MPFDFNTVSELVEYSFTLSPERKKEFLEILAKGEPFSEEFSQSFSEFLNGEIEFLGRNLLETEDEMRKQRHEKKKRVAEATPGLKKLMSEYRKLCADTKENLQHDLDKVETEYQKNTEKVIHEEVEGSQIDALHSFLKQKPQGKN